MTISFIVPGPVKGKGRPRAFRVGNGIRMHTDSSTAAYENRVAVFAKESMGNAEALTGPVAMTVDAVIAIPKSWPKKKQADALRGVIYPTGKPDADNVLKAICDGLNGVAFRDDAQIVFISMSKRYGFDPSAKISIREIGAEE